jgi:hypothetical protein
MQPAAISTAVHRPPSFCPPGGLQPPVSPGKVALVRDTPAMVPCGRRELVSGRREAGRPTIDMGASRLVGATVAMVWL